MFAEEASGTATLTRLHGFDDRAVLFDEPIDIAIVDLRYADNDQTIELLDEILSGGGNAPVRGKIGQGNVKRAVISNEPALPAPSFQIAKRVRADQVPAASNTSRPGGQPPPRPSNGIETAPRRQRVIPARPGIPCAALLLPGDHPRAGSAHPELATCSGRSVRRGQSHADSGLGTRRRTECRYAAIDKLLPGATRAHSA